MDSEHRHELEENWLANWLAVKIDAIKPYAPAIGVGLVVLVAAWIGYEGWRSSQANARADRWQDYARAVDSRLPDLPLLRQAAEQNPGTAVEEWSQVTWADGRLYEAANLFFRDRTTANEALDDAVEVYEDLVGSSDNIIAGRAAFQLARAYEMQGDLEKAREQYGRVTGPFASLAEQRAEELESDKVVESYEWITATTTLPPSESGASGVGDLEPDNLSLPETDPESALDQLLKAVEAQPPIEGSAAETAPSGPSLSPQGDADSIDGDGDSEDGEAEPADESADAEEQ